MKARFDLLQLGDLGFTVPAAAAIAAALAASRSGRAALRWCLLFAAGMLAVGLNKIAFMAWGAGVDDLAFKAASGHAAGATAVLPLLVYLSVQFAFAVCTLHATPGACALRRSAERRESSAAARHASMAAGLALGAGVALQLVLRCEHSPSEALAGCAIGALVSWGALGRNAPPCLRPAASAVCFGAVFVLAAWLMNSMHVAWWMVRAARLLAGANPLHDLAID